MGDIRRRYLSTVFITSNHNRTETDILPAIPAKRSLILVDTWQITATVLIEGKIETRFRETAENEALSIINGSLKNLSWLQPIEVRTTATRRIFEV